MNRTRILVITGVALLAVVAVLGWIRKTEIAPQSFINPGMYATDTSPATGVPAYASRPRVRVIEQQPVPQRVYSDRTVAASSGTRVYKERSKGKSVAIVAGSAGVGAAIGALAGGGKGAGIGALAGGGGGLVYDRLTHKKRVDE